MIWWELRDRIERGYEHRNRVIFVVFFLSGKILVQIFPVATLALGVPLGLLQELCNIESVGRIVANFFVFWIVIINNLHFVNFAEIFIRLL